MNSKQCLGCDGTGKRKEYDIQSSTYRVGNSPCFSCMGSTLWHEPDQLAIEAMIKGRKGKLASRPPKRDSTDPATYQRQCRAAYVWRMARFHGGVDMTMPTIDPLFVRHDPYHEILDTMADAMARKYLGSDLRAARRWGTAMGII